MAHDRWSRVGRPELVGLGENVVSARLERLGCTVTHVRNPMDGRLEVRTPDGRSLQVFVSTQPVGGYAFWTKRPLQPARHRFAALVLLDGDTEPGVYLVPSEEWLEASPALTDRDYEGRVSEPEYGIDIGRASLTSLRRYAWSEAEAYEDFH